MAKFAAAMAAGAVKTDNHPKRAHAKVALRRRLLNEIGADRARVLDCFAGAGAMHRAVWHAAADYTGCDLRWFAGDRAAFAVDNLRLLRAIELDSFTIFDLDAYGSPWKQATIIAARRTLAAGERLGLALTDGSPMRARLGRIEDGLAAMAGVDPGLVGMSGRWRELTARALETMAMRMNARVVDFWTAETGGRPILYSAAILEGLGQASGE